MATLKTLILDANDLSRQPVEAPEWGVPEGELFVRTLTGAERDAWEASIVQHKDKKTQVNLKGARASLLVRCLVDGTGARIFDDVDAPKLALKSSLVISRLYDVAAEMNGLREEDVEELVKASAADQSDDSTSD